jgi:AAA domain/Homeodomain-like domain
MNNPAAKIVDVYGTEHIYEPVRATIENEKDPGLILLVAPEVFREEFKQELFESCYKGQFAEDEEDVRAEKCWKREVANLVHLDDEETPLSFANEKHTEIIIASVRDHAKVTLEHADKLPIRGIVVLWPWEKDELKYLPKFTARYPQIPVYILWPNRTWEDDTFHEPGLFPRGGSAAELFDTEKEFRDLPDLTSVIEGIANEEEITVIGGLAKHGKTWFLLSIVKALLTGEPLFGYFKVPKVGERVVYLIPETSRRSFYARLRLMKIDQFLGSRLFVRTLSKGPAPLLDDPALLAAVKGADVFLDTVVRFITGEENSASDLKNFSAHLFGLQSAGARSVWGAHHSPKAFGEATTMTLENMLRGSGDLGAMLSNAYGLRQLDERSNLVHVQALASRDLPDPTLPFQIQGRPYIAESGDFKLVKEPGKAGVLSDHVGKKTGRPEDPAKQEKLQLILDLSREGVSLKEISDRAGVPKTTVTRWLQDSERPEL